MLQLWPTVRRHHVVQRTTADLPNRKAACPAGRLPHRFGPQFLDKTQPSAGGLCLQRCWPLFNLRVCKVRKCSVLSAQLIVKRNLVFPGSALWCA